MPYTDEELRGLWDDFREKFGVYDAEGLRVARNRVVDRKAELSGFGRLSGVQQDELVRLDAELTVLDTLIADRQVADRKEAIARGVAAMADPANREGPAGAPALVKGLGDRAETAAEVIQRAGNPWRDADGGPLTRYTSYGMAETSQGFISRCHTALEAIEPKVGQDGAEKLARVLAEQDGWPGVTVKRSASEREEAAKLFLALSNPYYLEAFRSAMRYPAEFASGGVGFETLTDEQRQAWREVRTNDLVRASFAEATGATGAFALPLQLDDTLIYTNAGAASPFRRLSRTVIGTSNTFNGVTTAGVTASWVAEGAAVSDATPSVGQLVITPYKEAAWITGSVEVLDDTTLDSQVPGVIQDARTRLEATAFTTGTGSGQPFGVVTRAASDTAVGALAASQIYGLLASLGPRFRVYDTAKPSWLANINIINAARQIPKFTGANFSIVDDGQADGIPEMLSVNFNEASAMTSLNTTGAKNLVIGDFSQYVIVDRLPTVVVAEPLVFNATPLPTGQRGWFFYARVGADITTAGAAFGANAFSVHTV